MTRASELDGGSGGPSGAEARRRALVFGATGLVGAALVERLLAEPGLDGVVTPLRRRVPELIGRPHVSAPVVDFDDLSGGLAGVRTTQVFVCLGTTMAKAGSEAAFRRVDHDAVIAAFRAALEAGAEEAFLVSSLGASETARSVYLRVKGGVEQAVLAMPFRAIHVFRPSLLTGRRAESRPAERLGILLGALIAPVLIGPVRRLRPVPADVVAAAMVATARSPAPGRWIHESEEIVRLARSGRGGAQPPRGWKRR